MPQTPSIHMGHGQMVDILAKDAASWEIVFSEAGVADYHAPPLAEVEADAIDTKGCIHALTIAEGDGVSSVRATGEVADAYRVRLRVVHGTHFHTRESFLPGALPIEPVLGAHGGSQTRFDNGLEIEVKPLNATTWELFFSRNGTEDAPPGAEAVTVQAIGPKAEDYQIRNLKTATSANGTSLLVEGKIKDAVYARIVLALPEGEAIRSIPMFLAN